MRAEVNGAFGMMMRMRKRVHSTTCEKIFNGIDKKRIKRGRLNDTGFEGKDEKIEKVKEKSLCSNAPLLPKIVQIRGEGGLFNFF